MRKVNIPINIKLLLLTGIALLLCASAFAQKSVKAKLNKNNPTISIYQTALEANTFDDFLSYLNLSGYDKLLKNGKGKYTLLLPTDEAMAKLPKPYIDSLELNRDKLKFYVAQHIIKKPVTAAQLKLNSYQTIGGKVVGYQSFPLGNTDIKTKNGYIQVLAKAPAPALPAAKKSKIVKRKKSMVALN